MLAMPRRSDPVRLDRFLAELARTGRLARAIAASGLSRSGLFKRRARDPAFAARWADAIARHRPRRPRRRKITHREERRFLAALLQGATLRQAAAATGFAHPSFLYRARRDPAFAALLAQAQECAKDRRAIARFNLGKPPWEKLDDWAPNYVEQLPPMTAAQAIMQLTLHNPNLRFQQRGKKVARVKTMAEVNPRILEKLDALERLWRWQEEGTWIA